jgi:hypothetical protein
MAIKKSLERNGFRAFTVRGPFEGTWEGQVEMMLEYSVGVPKKQIPKLKSLVAEILKGLGQRAMYFDAPEPSVEIISLEEEFGRPRKRRAKRKGDDDVDV